MTFCSPHRIAVALGLLASACSGDDAEVRAVSNGGSAGSSDGQTALGGSSDSHGGASGTERPYANVVRVVPSGVAESYTFSVSVESADIDCSQFADWWEVLAEDGTLLYRRILEHSHTDENGTSDADSPGNTFTRDGGPVPVGEQDVAFVRAHMSNAGYDGLVQRGTVADGFAPTPDVGSGFAAEVERGEPQPTGCAF